MRAQQWVKIKHLSPLRNSRFGLTRTRKISPHFSSSVLWIDFFTPPSTIRTMLIRFVHLLKVAATALTMCAGVQTAFAQSGCFVPIDGYLATLPPFNAPNLQNVAKSLRFEGAKHLQSAREGRLSTARDIPAYEQQMQGFSNSGREALANHIRQGGQLNEAICNPPEASLAAAWAATHMGVAFNTWAINTIRCAAGESNFAPIPQFCPYAAQTNAPALNQASPAPRDDPKVFGRSARGG